MAERCPYCGAEMLEVVESDKKGKVTKRLICSREYLCKLEREREELKRKAA
jgi:uncharacterized OB-fold protein